VLLIAFEMQSCHMMPYKTAVYPNEIDLTDQFDIKAASYDRTSCVFNYIKSDMQGKNAAQVWIYYPNAHSSESFKIYKQARLQRATDLVCAEYDFDKYQPCEIKGYLGNEDGSRKLNITDNYYNKNINIVFGKMNYSFKESIIPSYNYNFDWTDLNTMIPYLKEKCKNFEIGIIAPDNFAKFHFVGKTDFLYMGKANKNDIVCDLYKVVVENHKGKKGFLYINAENYDLVEIDMELPNNQMYKSFKMVLKGKEYMSMEKWNNFIKEKTINTLK
jgi:hypothetical protein